VNRPVTRYLAGVMVAAVICGCSWITSVAVVNRSTQPLRVRYTLRQRSPSDLGCNCPAGYIYEQPALLSLDSLRHRPWYVMPDSAVHFDASTRSFDLILPPNMALRISTLGLYTGDSSVASSANVVFVSIEGASGSRAVSGVELLRSLHKVDNGLYTLEYP